MSESVKTTRPTGLPPAVNEPMPRDEWSARLPARVERLATEVFGDRPVYLLLKTTTRVDVGSWLGSARVWLACLDGEILLLAAGPRPYDVRLPASELHESVYNPVTGQLLLAPAGHRDIEPLGLPPREAYQVLAQVFEDEETPHAPDLS